MQSGRTACHGPTGISVSDTVPNLAAQRARYLEAQLKFFKDGTRKEPGGVSRAAIMNAIAAQLSADDITNVAAYFEAQAGANAGAKSALVPEVAETKITFPEQYKNSFVKYRTIDFPNTKEVRYYYANRTAAMPRRTASRFPMARSFSPRSIRQNWMAIILSKAKTDTTCRTS
jgi:Cytochrome c